MAKMSELLDERDTSVATAEETLHTDEQVITASAPEVSIPAVAPRPYHLFEEALLEMSTTRPGHRTTDFVLSVMIHGVLLATLLLIPLYFTEGIDLTHFYQTILVAPPPPPPPPPPVAQVISKGKAAPPRRVFTSAGKLLAPTVVPRTIAMLKEKPLPPEVTGAGVVGGVPGGVPGGQAGGVIGGIISNAPRPTFLPPPPTQKVLPPPIRVGGRVKPPRLLYGPNPVYPTLAKLGRIEGEVLIDAVIDAEGNVVQMQVVSGHSLLVPAALAALSQWKYEPTYLNDKPVPVQFIVTVRFSLSH
jgi:periplasmic protein TonB